MQDTKTTGKDRANALSQLPLSSACFKENAHLME
jgi:hypothetical protein